MTETEIFEVYLFKPYCYEFQNSISILRHVKKVIYIYQFTNFVLIIIF